MVPYREATRIVWTPGNHIRVSFRDRSPEAFIGSEAAAGEMADKAGLHPAPLTAKAAARMWVRRQ